MFKTYTFDSGIKGTNILILGAVHGNETAGTKAQQEIISQIEQGQFSILKGVVTFVPIVNKAAYQKDKRYIDVNLNRVICRHQTPQNNEEKIANRLITLIDNCDVMLDLHSTHCPEDKEFAFIDYPEEKNIQMLSILPIKTALAGWPKIYSHHPEITNFCTEEYAHKQGKTGLTVECGYHKSPQAVTVAKKSIMNILSYFGNISHNHPTPTTPQIIYLDSFITKQDDGCLNKNYKHLDKISAGEIIATYKNGKQITAPFDGYIIMPNHEATIGAEWFYLGK